MVNDCQSVLWTINIKGRILVNTKDSIVAAAMSTISEQGFYETTVSDIVARAGVAQGTFYIYFEHKKEIIEEIIQKIKAEVEQEIAEEVKAKDEPMAKIKKGLQAGYRVYQKYQDIIISLQEEAIVVEIQNRSRCVKEEFASTQLVEWIEEGKEKGVFSVVTPLKAAFFIILLFERTAYCCFANKGFGSFEENYSELVGFIERGLGYRREHNNE